jgi:hypothetical protein
VIEFEEPPFDLPENTASEYALKWRQIEKAPADLTTWPRTLEIIAGIIAGSAIAAAAAYFLFQ